MSYDIDGPDLTTEIRRECIRDMAAEVREVNEANGWFEENRTIGEGMALLHSEVSEAFEAWRKRGTDRYETTTHTGMCALFTQTHECDCGAVPKPDDYGSELADVLIRLLDQCDRDGVDLVAEFERKLAYNATRGYKHGGRAV